MLNSDLTQISLTGSFPPEFLLLVECSWLAPHRLHELQRTAIASRLAVPINWDIFIDLTERHRVQTLAYIQLSRHGSGKVPENVLRHLKERSTACRLLALRQAAEFARLADRLAAAGIQVLPFKGVTLSERLFGDPGTRHSRDIDLLVKPEDIETACLILESDGYSTRPPRNSLSPRQHQSFIRHFHHFEYSSPAGVPVELHWSLYAWPAEQVRQVWEHSVPAEYAGIGIRTLDDDMLLLTLCDHGAKHAWFRLKWLSDIVQLLTGERPEGWGSAIALAEQLDLKRTLAQAAALVHRIYGIRLPDEISALVSAEREIERLCQPALEGVSKSSEELASFGKRMEGLQAVLQIWQRRPSLSWRTVLMPILTQPADYRDFPLPDSLFWLYIPLRPYFWLRRHYLKPDETRSGNRTN